MRFVTGRLLVVTLLLASAGGVTACGPSQTPDGCTEQARIYIGNAITWQCAGENLTLSGDLTTAISRAGSGESCHRTGDQFQDFIVPLAFMYWGTPARLTMLIHGYEGATTYTKPDVSLWIQSGLGTYRSLGGTVALNGDEASGSLDVPLQLIRRVKAGKTLFGEQKWQQVTSNVRLRGTFNCPAPPPCPGTENYHSASPPACVEQSLLVDRYPWSRAAVIAPCGAAGRSFVANLVYGANGHPEELTIRIPAYHGPGAYAPWDVAIRWPQGYRPAGQVLGAYGNVVVNPGETTGYLTSNYGITGPAETGVEFQPFPTDGYARAVAGAFRCR